MVRKETLAHQDHRVKQVFLEKKVILGNMEAQASRVKMDR